MARLLLKDKDNRVSTDGSALHGWSARLCRPSQKSQKKQHSFSTPTSWPTQLTTGDKNRKKNKARKAQVRTNTKLETTATTQRLVPVHTFTHLAQCHLHTAFVLKLVPPQLLPALYKANHFLSNGIWRRDWNLIKNPTVPTISLLLRDQILPSRFGFVWRFQLRLLFSFFVQLVFSCHTLHWLVLILLSQNC